MSIDVPTPWGSLLDLVTDRNPLLPEAKARPASPSGSPEWRLLAHAGDDVDPPPVPVQTAIVGISDTLLHRQWHLENTGQSGGVAGIDINLEGVWDDYTGAGVAVGIWDDGVQRTHHDLDDNYDAGLHIVVDGVLHDPAPGAPGSAHGTAVAGVIAAEVDGVGTVGVAYGATIAGVDIFYDPTLNFDRSFDELDNFDVTNHSWGFTVPFVANVFDPDWAEFFGGWFESVKTGRGGSGPSTSSRRETSASLGATRTTRAW